jgi:hypothetical protein
MIDYLEFWFAKAVTEMAIGLSVIGIFFLFIALLYLRLCWREWRGKEKFWKEPK